MYRAMMTLRRWSGDSWLLSAILFGGASVMAVSSATTPAHADAASSIHGGATTSTDGNIIYQQVCQACHMANARGAIGAGVIPSLAANPKLRSAGYPVYMILNGKGGMPWLGDMLNDVQIAAVANYVRSNFGNHYSDVVKAADVTAIRGPALHSEN